MLHMIGHALFGLVVGLVARMLLPGRDPVGLIITCLLGVAGGWLGGWLGKQFGMYQEGSPVGFLMSVVGAMILFLAYRMI